jgi:hypothetical protein
VLFVGNQLTTPSNRLIAENGLHRRHAVEMETERKSRRRCIMFMSPSSVEARPIDLRVLRPATRSTRPGISSPTGGASNACSNTQVMFGWYRLVLVVVVVFNTSKLTHKKLTP